MENYMTPLTAPNISISTEASDFCVSHNLSSSLELAMDHVAGAFPDAVKFSVELEEDPEADYRWVKINVAVAGTVATVHPRFLECAAKLARSLKWPTCTLIRADYTIAEKP